MDGLSGWLRRRGLVSDLKHDMGERITYDFPGNLMRRENVFAESEEWLEKFFDFKTAKRRYGTYERAYRHLCCNASFKRFMIAYALRDICETEGVGSFTLSGLDGMLLAYYQHRFGKEPKGKIVMANGFLSTAVKVFLVLSVAVYVFGWIASRTRLRPAARKAYLLGCEFIGDIRETYLWHEVAEGPEDVLCILRNESFRPAFDRFEQKVPTALFTDGFFLPLQGLSAITEALSHMASLAAGGRGLPVDFFRQLVLLPYRRMVFRALFNRYKFRFFWSRDEYSTEHIIRSQELRRTGGVPMGIMHGIPSVCNIIHPLRYLDYDIFYVHGRHQYERYYRDKWPDRMRVRPIGSFGMTREQLNRLAEPRPANIACFIAPLFGIDQIIDAIEAVARAFPEKKVFVNTKRAYAEGLLREKIAGLMERGPDNLEIHTGRSYELFYTCRHVLSDGSTLGAEAIQFGHSSFVFDFDRKWKDNVYREFPDICVRSAEEIIGRIRSLEDGTWSYPREQFAPLIEMTGRVPWDIIREDMGLPAKQGPIPALAFIRSAPVSKIEKERNAAPS